MSTFYNQIAIECEPAVTHDIIQLLDNILLNNYVILLIVIHY